MNIDLFPIINNEGQAIDFSGKVEFDFEGVFVSADVTGKVANFAGRLELTACADAVVKTSCARCLRPIEKNISFSIDEPIGGNNDEHEPETYLNGTVLDAGAVVMDQIVIDLPIRYLCSEDCKGFCSRCGADRNQSECACGNGETDERFAALKSLLEE